MFFVTGITDRQLEQFCEEVKQAALRGAKTMVLVSPAPDYIHVLEFDKDKEPRTLTLSEFAQEIADDYATSNQTE